MRFKHLFCGLALTLILGGVAMAESVTLHPDAPERYVVKRGDTLWDISEHFLRDPWLWPEIWQVNPEIKNPHLIYPGDVVFLTYDADGRPMLTVQRGRPTVKLSPKTRPSRIDKAISTIPIDAIQQFLTPARVVTKEEYDQAPYIVAFQDGRVIASSTNKAYVRGLSTEEAVSRYSIVRLGKPYRNPDAKKDNILGYETIEVANANLMRDGDPASFTIADSNREAMKGDRLFPVVDEIILQTYTPHAPEKDVEGLIIEVLDGVSRIGQYHVVVLNIGADMGIERGHVLSVHQSGRQVRDPFAAKRSGDVVTLPDEEAGVVLVFRTFEKVSYALVMRALRDIRLHDKVTNPS